VQLLLMARLLSRSSLLLLALLALCFLLLSAPLHARADDESEPANPEADDASVETAEMEVAEERIPDIDLGVVVTYVEMDITDGETQPEKNARVCKKFMADPESARTYFDRYETAKCFESFRRWPEAEKAYLRAFDFRPTEVQPLLRIAEHYHNLDEHAAAFEYAKRASEVPPSGTLVFDEDPMPAILEILGIQGWYVGDFAAGEAALVKALELTPDDNHLKDNLRHYVERREGKDAKEWQDGKDAEAADNANAQADADAHSEL
jgi:tetratricopeptide (TPR) repeat protein